MTKKIIKILSVALFTFNIVYSQAPGIEWQKCYGGSGSDICYCIQATNDDGSVACGRTGSVDGDVSVTPHGTGDFWIVKLDASGTISWEKSLVGNNGETAYNIQQTVDGVYSCRKHTLK